MDDKKQLHAGNTLFTGKSIWHTNSDGGYWSGWIPENATPQELYYACMTTLIDLEWNHPELPGSFLREKLLEYAKQTNTI